MQVALLGRLRAPNMHNSRTGASKVIHFEKHSGNGKMHGMIQQKPAANVVRVLSM